MGKISYNGKGEQQYQEDWYPVFLSSIEVIKSGFSLQELRRKYQNIN
ncbi:MAG: hypothetical protein IPG12_10870 [Saprospiraceae bacterium]|nr:hypothetical protein [Saprospiraceae bacterium]